MPRPLGRPHSAIVVDEEYLHRPCAHAAADAEIEVADAFEEDGPDDQELIAAATLETLIFHPGFYPSLKRIAERHGVSTSTIKRRLMRCSINYRDLVDDVRREHVSHYLTFTDIPTKEIAYRLGFTNVHNFRRAFGRWMDQTPKQYRRQFRVADLSHAS